MRGRPTAPSPEERIAGRLRFWLQRQRPERHEPTEAEVAAERAALLAEVAAQPRGGPAPPTGRHERVA